MRKFLACVFSVVFILVSFVYSALGQTQASTGQISGIVTDTNDNAIAGASVTITNSAIGLTREVKAGADGLFKFVLLPPGTYNLSVTASGFSPTSIENIQVSVGSSIDIPVKLSVGSLSASVTVAAGDVETTRQERSALINETAIDNLPINGRRFQDFVTLTPTAQVDPQRGQISLVGQRGINVSVNVDGLEYSQPFFGGIRGGERSNTAFTIPQESIQEFQVVTSGYTAEFGRSSGGIITAVTKSGTNDVRGSAFYLLRHKKLAARNAFGQLAAPTQQQFGGSIGGPIIKDRIFYFGAYEQQRVRNPRAVLFDMLSNFTPTSATKEAYDFYKSLETPFTQTNDAYAVLVRFDFQLDDNNRWNLRYNRSSNKALNANATGNQLFPTTVSALSNNGTERDRTNGIVTQLVTILSPTLVNELRGQFAREDRPREANSLQPTVETAIGRFGTVNFLPTTQFDWRFQVADNLTWTKDKHTLKFGAEYNYVYTDQFFAFNQFGRFIVSGSNTATILDILSLGGSIPNRFDSTSVTYLRQIGNGIAKFSTKEPALFIQDSWRLRPNLTLYYGLRWEAQINPQPEATNTDLVNKVKSFPWPFGYAGKVDPTKIDSDLTQFGPRLGVAWDPFKDSRTVVRGYAGIYNARTPMLLFAAPLNNFREIPGDLSVQLPFPVPAGNPNNTVYKQFKLIGIDLNAYNLGNLPQLSVDQIQAIAKALGISFDPFFGSQPIFMAPNYKNPRSYQAGGSLEREVLSGLVIGADFTYVNTVHLERNRELNIPYPTIRPSDPAQRPFFGLRSGNVRPLSSLGSVQMRESSARALYRGITLRSQLRKPWGQLYAAYTYSKTFSDDDNERDAGGVQYENGFNLKPEYGPSRLDRRHQFVASPVFFLPLGVDISSAVRLLSGRPIDASMGFDANEDLGGPDRPYAAPGVPFVRNGFRNKPYRGIDMRLQKRVNLSEQAKLILSVEAFNIFGFKNIELAGSTVTNYCSSPVPLNCGFSSPTNINFLQLRDQNPSSPRYGSYLLNNNPGEPRQIQLGVRLQF